MIVQQKIMLGVADADPYFANVVGLYHFDDPAYGAGGGVSAGQSGYFFDSSARARHVSASNSSNSYKDTTNAKFGPAAFRQTSSGGASPFPGANNSDWVFGTADLTIEVWARNGYARSDSLTLNPATGVTVGVISWMLQSNSSNGGISYALHNTGVSIHSSWNANSRMFTGGTSNGAGNWDFFSWCRNAGAWYMHMNGILLTPNQFTGDGVPASRDIQALNVPYLANFFGTATVAGSFVGWFDELRITKGVGRYGNSNYSVPTKPFPNY